ncbi:MAG: hypothetical protein ABSA66_03055 [Roseiarcus sp.]|jgi:hypothetical protein
MSDNNNDDTDDLADPFYYEDSVSQRAMAFYYVAKLSDTIKDKAIKELCLTMLRKLNGSIKAPSTAELRTIDGGAQLTTPHSR